MPVAPAAAQPNESGAEVARRTQLSLGAWLIASNLLGAALIFVLAVWVLPLPEVDDPAEVRIANAIAFTVYMGIATPIATVWIARRLRGSRDWLRAERTPDTEERLAVLRAPFRIALVHAAMWSLAAAAFGILNVTFSGELGQRAAISIALAGVTTSAIAYLVAERELRPAAARALATGMGERPVAPGVKARAVLAWALGTGVPVVGVIMVGLSTLVEHDFTANELATTVLVLGAIALAAGLYVSVLAARAVADPIVSVREALSRVERGELDVEVPVYDGSEVGLLQSGFNRMVAGLRERERIRDLFGRHVGEDVARVALERDVELGGEVRDVSMLFVDLVGSTQLAATRPPEEVVTVLNRFFAVVVEVVRKHGGWVNKFEGDAALAVFGAPVPLDDAPDRALAAARELAERLRREVPEVEAAIGVAAGEAVAGNIGEEQRYEYTVIGDPVNEAARLTELAKSKPGRVLASAAIVERASESEASNWQIGEAVTLRGRTSETRLATPA
jgi:adenylate cyclase